MGRSVSIRDIARAAGVSHTTVSRALRDSSLISADVRGHVQQLAREMGYTPNAVAQSLKSQQTNTVGLVVTSISDPFVGRVVRGIDDVAQQAHISVFLAGSYNDPDREMAVIETFHKRRVDGILVASSLISARYASRLAHIHVPTVLINPQADMPGENLHTVAVDDTLGAVQAVEHLIGLGHRAIGYLGAANRPRSNRLRLEGYRQALQAAGIEPQEAWVRMGPAEHQHQTEDVADGKALLPDLLRAGVSAVFCINDMVAIGALLACRELGLAVPDQFSITGFDDIETAQYVTPPLTTVHQPKLRLGQTAMEMMLDLWSGRPVEDQVLPTELVERGTTAAPLAVQDYEGKATNEIKPTKIAKIRIGAEACDSMIAVIW